MLRGARGTPSKTFVDTDFNVIRRNEEVDLRSNIKVQTTQTNIIPQYGAAFTFYTLFFLVQKAVFAFYLPFMIGFIEYP